jgi:hypothetical protein
LGSGDCGVSINLGVGEKDVVLKGYCLDYRFDLIIGTNFKNWTPETRGSDEQSCLGDNGEMRDGKRRNVEFVWKVEVCGFVRNSKD